MPIDKSQSLSATGIAGLRATGLIDARTLRSASGVKDSPASSSPAGLAGATPAVTFQPSEALDPGQPPVDVERVAVIRKAIESGAYPVIPTKIADAMIAAGLLLRATA
ncbi:flagellar biosynthesis anti-sigma factor FlgM [Novosphingobium bradum]|uniref:Flagellar biosynthesis anti-sigma factor FlgM n=1 Tax=Novosphingobium bradum TaxID=1737444 RepID=A0ABV7IUY2_9SPHN